MPIEPGLYEQVINEHLAREIAHLEDEDKRATVEKVDEAEAPQVISHYVAGLVEQSLQAVSEQGESSGASLAAQRELANKIIGLLHEAEEGASPGAGTGSGEDTRAVTGAEAEKAAGRAGTSLPDDKPVSQLLSVVETKNNVYALDPKKEPVRPETSISRSSLFTGAVNEPQMASELKKEIASCDRIDMLVSFIKWSGLRLIYDELEHFTARGGRLRVITTTYIGATEAKAIERLASLPNAEIKISYDTKSARLHAKAYMFFRKSGFSTVYVGSSNISSAALSTGLEWNVKLARQDLPETVDKIAATFESYWESPDFESFDLSQTARLLRELKAERSGSSKRDYTYFFDIRPYPFQQQILDQLEAERKVRGHWSNLVVAATGTGKTVISAFDYKRYCAENGGRNRIRLLFVAHREEILEQSIACFRGVLGDENFGSLFVGSHRPDDLNHLFVSIQTFNSRDFTDFIDPDFYDFVIVDEFHHAAAPSYRKLLEHLRPTVLLGLTATPERMDGKNVLEYFDNRIAAEIRLPEAIDRKLLCPFQYFGISDSVDLSAVKWTRGGYDVGELTNVYTMSGMIARERVRLIIGALNRYLADIQEMKALGFCVSVEHAHFMARCFNERNIPAMSLSGDSTEEERRSARQRLVTGDIKVIFVVDIYNEGVDIPEVDTVMFLRPTQSLTIFLQQLGRGLRLCPGKDFLTVLDFIGQARRQYDFESKFAALLENTNHSVRTEIERGFPSLPKGCYIQLEKQAQKHVLDNISSAIGDKNWLVTHLRSFEEDSGRRLTLADFVDYHHLDVRAIYARGTSFSRLCSTAGVREPFQEPDEDTLTKALAHICSLDSRRWLTFLIDTLENPERVNAGDLSGSEIRMLKMFQITVWPKSFKSTPLKRVSTHVDAELAGALLDNIVGLKRNTVLYSEMLELMRFKLDRIDFVDEPVPLGFDCPLDLHCQYTRDQIFVALDFMSPDSVLQGVKWLPEKNIDVLINTLNKSERDYSPTTMYKDYSISSTLFHWQSQSATTPESPTGRRYINHRERGSKVLLFVREYKRDMAGTAPFTFLGTANFVSTEGSKPMNIIWRLDRPIPAKFLKKTNKLIAG